MSTLSVIASCDSDDAEHHSNTIGCKDDARIDGTASNLEKKGKNGQFTFILSETSPNPPARGVNRWTVKVKDAQGNTVTGLTVTADPRMPDHGHGSSTQPTVSAEGDAYIVEGISLYMAGLWQVTIAAQGSGVSDSAIYSYCIEG